MMIVVSLLLLSLTTAKAYIFPGCDGGTTNGCPSVLNTTLHWIEQPIDHFGWAQPLTTNNASTYRQRYFVNDNWWTPGSPIFFYFGNEDNVELYVNHTGLMWESAPEFKAMLVFAEHRYYGESKPYKPGTKGTHLHSLIHTHTLTHPHPSIYKVACGSVRQNKL